MGLRCSRLFPGYAGLPGAVGHWEMCSCIHWDCPYLGSQLLSPIPSPTHPTCHVLWIHTWDPKTPIPTASPLLPMQQDL